MPAGAGKRKASSVALRKRNESIYRRDETRQFAEGFDHAYSTKRIPDLILLNMFKYVTEIKDIVSIRAVSQRWETLSKKEEVTKHIRSIDCRNLTNLSSEMLEDVLTPVAGHTQVLNLNGCSWIRPKKATLQRCTNLRFLGLISIRLHTRVVISMIARNRNLNHLCLSSSVFDKLMKLTTLRPSLFVPVRHLVIETQELDDLIFPDSWRNFVDTIFLYVYVLTIKYFKKGYKQYVAIWKGLWYPDSSCQWNRFIFQRLAGTRTVPKYTRPSHCPWSLRDNQWSKTSKIKRMEEIILL